MLTKALLVARSEAGMPLVAFLARRLKTSRKQAKRLLDERQVFVNRRRVWMARHALQPGDEVELSQPHEPARSGGAAISILYRDGDYVVVNKPAGVETCGAGSLEERLQHEFAEPGLQAVHRLDRDTSGCLWLARNAEARAAAVRLFKGRGVGKIYEALVAGRVRSGETTVQAPLEGRTAITHLRVLASTPKASHVKVRIETGRTHQIRRHLALLRHPVLGDRAYFTGLIRDEQIRRVPRQMLHASGLTFTHPATGQRVRVKAPLPGDFRRLLDALGLAT